MVTGAQLEREREKRKERHRERERAWTRKETKCTTTHFIGRERSVIITSISYVVDRTISTATVLNTKSSHLKTKQTI
jgi:hypothetical protein